MFVPGAAGSGRNAPRISASAGTKHRTVKTAAMLLSEDRNGAWLGRQTEPTGVAGRKADSAAASLAGVHAAFTWWRDLAASLDDETLNTPLGEMAGYFADATGRSFVLHIADELIYHTAEAALLRDLFADVSVRS